MNLKTIGQVSRDLGISTRMLRYYEKSGLITSSKKPGYSYRVYDEDTILQLSQIIFLRKLRFSIKQIAVLLSEPDIYNTIKIFTESLNEVKDEINALSTIKVILNNIITELEKKSDLELKSIILNDKTLTKTADTLVSKKNEFREEKNMNELNEANKELSKLKNVKIIYLPPFTVAASHYIGISPEEEAEKALTEFIKENNLFDLKPDTRVFGFNHPSPTPEKAEYGYEFWVTIPNDMEVKKPMLKKTFEGGLYASHTINFGNFHEWEWLMQWVTEDNPKYMENYREETEECMGGLLEEHINFAYGISGEKNISEHQIDLLYPVKLK